MAAEIQPRSRLAGMPAPRRLVALFAYVPGVSSGMMAANRMAVEALARAGIAITMIPTPAWGGGGFRFHACGYASALLGAWMRLLGCAWRPPQMLLLGCGQTGAAFCREVWLVWILLLIRPRISLIVTLHGSVFMTWGTDRLLQRAFIRVWRRADVVTCLGPGQRAKLIGFGLAQGAIRIVNNASDVNALDGPGLERKWSEASRWQLLHLSNLIESKGYQVYLTALQLLNTRPGPAIHAVLCGRFLPGDSSAESGQQVIERCCRELNGEARVKLEWIQGAFGSEKEALFKSCHIFVLPTVYRVEAQPLVLIEAMAQGCAVVSTSAGEIPAMFRPDDALLLRQVTADTVAAAIGTLVTARERTLAMGMAGWERFHQAFTRASFDEAWMDIGRDRNSAQ